MAGSPHKKYPRRYPRITTLQLPPSDANPDAQQQYQKDLATSIQREIWELLKRVWALEQGTSGPGDVINNIIGGTNISITNNNNGTITINNSGGSGGSGFFWALTLGQ